MNRLESIWVELKLCNNKPILFGLFYRPPNSDAAAFSQIEDSINLAVNSGISDIIITGDFNLNTQAYSSCKKVESLCQQNNIQQLISEPTHFTEQSSSIIDLMFVNNKETVVAAGVGEPFLQQHIRFHCPVFGVFRYNKPKSKSFQRRIWRYDLADYDRMRLMLSSEDWSSLKHANLDTYVDNVTSAIIEAAKHCIPTKLVNIRQQDCPWFNSIIKRKIRQRK